MRLPGERSGHPESGELEKRVSMGHTCPKCGSKIIDRVKRQDLLERLVLFLRRKRVYRCLDCDYRFYDSPQTNLR
jgi:DNA-directed RNA polymerase subunit RPC12/RpoP